MAIKITGTTVINDSRELENITDISQISKKPQVISPTNNETDIDRSGITIVGGGYNAVFGGSRDYREFQVDLATGNFSSPVVSQQVNADSLTLTTDLAALTDHKVRIRDVDLDGTVSDFSDVVAFTTALDPFDALGNPGCGGFYMGTICAACTCYNLIVAPNASGCASCDWKTSRTLTLGTCDLCDGYDNTYPAMENSTHPAGNWTATRTIGGFSDWYLPSVEELRVFYGNGAGAGPGDPLPAGEDFSCGFAANIYWSSTESDYEFAQIFRFGTSPSYGSSANFKERSGRVRAVRREPI